MPRAATWLVPQVSELLTQRLDGMMVGFKTTQPELFGEYQSARVVVQASSRAKADVFLSM